MGSSQELIPGLPFDVALRCLVRVPHSSHPQMQRVCRQWEDLVTSADFYALRQRSATTRWAICVAQARRDPGEQGANKGTLPRFGLSLFDPAARSWEKLPPIPELGDQGIPLFAAIAAVDSKLFVLGGWDPSSYAVMRSVFIFDFSRGAWSRGADMPGSPRSFFACAALGGSIFVAGGHDESKNALRSCYRYAARENRWEAMSDMSQERDESKGIAVSIAIAGVGDRSSRPCTRFGVVSGYATDSQGEFGASAELLDPATGHWLREEEFVRQDLVSDRTGASLIVAEPASGSGFYSCDRSSGEVWIGSANSWRSPRKVGQFPASFGKMVAASAGNGRLVLVGQDERGVCRGFALAGGDSARDPKDSARDSRDSQCWEPLGDGGDEFSGLVQAFCSIEI